MLIDICGDDNSVDSLLLFVDGKKRNRYGKECNNK